MTRHQNSIYAFFKMRKISFHFSFPLSSAFKAGWIIMHLINFDSIPTTSYENNITKPESTTVSPQFNTTFSYQTDNFDTQHDILFADQLPFFHNKIISYNESTTPSNLNSTNAPTTKSIVKTQVAVLASIPAIFFFLTVVILLVWFLHQKRREGIFYFNFIFFHLSQLQQKLHFLAGTDRRTCRPTDRPTCRPTDSDR